MLKEFSEKQAICVEYAHIPIFYSKVLLPDQSRSEWLVMADPENELYRVSIDGKFVYGTILAVHSNDSARVEDYVFVESHNPQKLNRSELDFANQLRKCGKIMKILENKNSADDFYCAMAGTDWKYHGKVYKLSARSAGKIVANLRGLNECYIDFFGSFTEQGKVNEDILELLSTFGFKLLNCPNSSENIARAKQILEICKTREKQDSPPQWFAVWSGYLGQQDQRLLNHMLYCCFFGQCSLEEWEEFYIKIRKSIRLKKISVDNSVSINFNTR